MYNTAVAAPLLFSLFLSYALRTCLIGQACGMSGSSLHSTIISQTHQYGTGGVSGNPDWLTMRLLLLTVFLLLLCGITASCIRFCCRKKRPPVETFSRHPYDLAAIAIDSDSTAHSTVTSYSSWQYPLTAPIHSIFVDMDKNTMSPPAYSLYAMDLPPSYDEAVQRGKQCNEVAQKSQKLSDIPGEVTPGGLSPIQCSPDTINRDPATQANSGNPEDATQEQPQL